MFFPNPLVKLSKVGSLRDREVAYSASDHQGFNFESCVWRAVSSHHPQEAQVSLYVHKSGLKPDSFYFHFIFIHFYFIFISFSFHFHFIFISFLYHFYFIFISFSF